jgi:hypothetical protein
MTNSKMRRILRTLLMIAVLATCLVMPTSNTGGNHAQAANAATYYGYYDTWYTDGTFSEECGFYNSCTGQRSGCRYTGFKTTEIIVCGSGPL